MYITNLRITTKTIDGIVMRASRHEYVLVVSVTSLVDSMCRYVKSRNDAQLRSPKEENDVQTCAPEDNVAGHPIVPCGLVAWSLFNDTYKFSRNSQELLVNKKDISWKSDRDSKFGKNVYPKNFQTGAPIGGGILDPKKPVIKKTLCITFQAGS